MRYFAAVALTCVASAVKTRMWGDMGFAPSDGATNNAWMPSGNDFDFGSVFGKNSDVWKKSEDKVSADTNVANVMGPSGMKTTPMSTTTQPSTGHDIKDAGSYFGDVFGQGFDDKFKAAD